jgi:hypothetical protein
MEINGKLIIFLDEFLEKEDKEFKRRNADFMIYLDFCTSLS